MALMAIFTRLSKNRFYRVNKQLNWLCSRVEELTLDQNCNWKKVHYYALRALAMTNAVSLFIKLSKVTL
jgi:hypothetical protein